MGSAQTEPQFTDPDEIPTVEEMRRSGDEQLVRLAQIRDRVGETAFAIRAEEARSRRAHILAFERARAGGATADEARERAGIDASLATIRRWKKLYEEGGIAYLIDRRGSVATRSRAERLGSARRIESQKRRRGPRPTSFIKWAGSKRFVMDELLPLFPPVDDDATYFEPMVGAGTVFLKYQPTAAVLGDANPELMNCYQVIRDDVDALVEELDRHESTHEHFLEVRAQVPESLPPVSRAARTIFLNKTCFNGLYRLNLKGQFNVPYGRMKNASYRDAATLRWVHAKLQDVELRCGDVESTVEDATAGDVIYFDPPYYPVRVAQRRSHYYDPTAFSPEDHARLAALFRALDDRGCRVVLTNSEHPVIRELYDGYEFVVLEAYRRIGAKKKSRRKVHEVVIHNL